MKPPVQPVKELGVQDKFHYNGPMSLVNLIQGLRSLLLPPACAGCQTPLPEIGPTPLCRACWDALPRSRPPWRRVYGRSFDQVVSPCRYGGVIQELIVSLKYEGRLSLIPFLGQLLAEPVREHLGTDPAEGIVPVPLHPTRLRERTFNQAQFLAQNLAGRLKLPCWSHLLSRKEPTRSQSELPQEERWKNVQGAFALNPDPLIRYARLLLVDDVFTTGATAESCARLLKQGGAAQVTVVAAAHG